MSDSKSETPPLEPPAPSSLPTPPSPASETATGQPEASSSEEASDAAPSAPTNSAEGSENSDESGMTMRNVHAASRFQIVQCLTVASALGFYEYLLDKGESLVKKDVDNIVQRVKAEFRGGRDDDDTCAQALTEFAAMDGNVATVDETDAGHSGVMSMTSRHQRDMTVRFPELLLVDCTHKTNRYNYQLCTLMVIDDNDHLLRVDDKIGEKVQVIMVDKDLHEIRVLKKYFPKARVLICFFHVIKYQVVVSGKHKEHYVDLSNWSCSCSFACAMRLPCQHAIAYRKWKKVSGSVIPLSRIHERWLHPAELEQMPRPIVVNEFKPGQTKRKALDAATKYRQALSATQAICNELADIEDEDEYKENLDFLLKQWANIRQRKRIKITNSNPFVETDGDDQDTKSPTELSIRLNPKAAETGRPRLNTKEREAEDKKKRALFNESEEHRRKMGEVTLVQLAQDLQREKPTLQETLDRVSPIPTKWDRASNKKPKYVRQSAPVLSDNAFYLRPKKLLDKCLSVLPVKNTRETAIEIFTQSQPSQAESDDTQLRGQDLEIHGQNLEIECVQISGIGTFSRAHIEAMCYLSTMKDQCEQGVKFCTWLLQNVISTIPSVQHPVLENMVNQVAKSNPQSTIVIEATEYHYAMLYRLKPPSWANDALIHAFCTRLCATNPTARVLRIESTVTGRNAEGMNESLKKKAQELVGEADLLMIPVYVGNSHWCGIAVDVKRTRVLYYDSMNQRTYKTVLDRLSWDLAKTLSDDFEVVSINAPIQTDGHNCGFFVMLRLWRMVDNSIALDVTPKGLTILRFHMLQLVLHGRSN
ncbi:SUMO protease, putative [Phytophthora infestans T30-4]|uniref:SUMO protease, putative n=1 Tax=Phytophthora infestans (strain T30-4) TaxID=403677 RepID=D0NHU4_PHYIT|nr:SUMO protease, putative [Phytophthora infestans T30-4]EEY58819.1 SUMO protease, putative [Phytophthora infestans T30-4]|eukprot:XP_002901292.1 SUMO protease, putative [Phytophthora infestans T30-4]